MLHLTTPEEQQLLKPRLLQLYAQNSASSMLEFERTTLRSESVHMRDLLAHAASHGTLNFGELSTQLLAGKVSPLSLDPEALVRLAHVTALHEVFPEDVPFATRALEAALPRLPGGRHKDRGSKLLADLYFEQERFAELDGLLKTVPGIKRHFYAYLAVDSKSPFVRQELAGNARVHAEWLERFNRQFTRNDLLPVHLRAVESEAPFNRLTSHPVHGPQPEGPLVTVIMTSFKPVREDVLQSARSILEQTWRNLELLVVDDCSPDEYTEVLDELATLDDRLRVIRLSQNGGTYKARNVGIQQARGEFITGQDADDWSHPQRLQTQVTHLLRNPKRPGNQVYTVNMTEDLVRIRRGYTPFIPSAPTLMVRAEIMRKLGGYVPARKASDNELRDRVSAYAGHDVYQIAEPLIFMRILPNSLSRSDFRPGWQHPARRAFWSSYRTWHREAPRDELQITPEAGAPIYVPPRFTQPPEDSNAIDVLFIADWCESGQTQLAALEEINALRREGYTVGVMHMENAVHLSRYARTYITPIQDLISRERVIHVIHDEPFHEVKLAVVRSPELLQFMSHEETAFRLRTLVVIADKMPWEEQDFWVHYIPEECAEHGRAYFGRRPQWVARSPKIHKELQRFLPAHEISQEQYVTAFNPQAWRNRRRPPYGAYPVIGRWAGEVAALWPSQPSDVRSLWPTTGDADVRLYGDPTAGLKALGESRMPLPWVSFRHNEISRRTYYRSLDFFVHYTQRYGTELELPVLEAMAAGCVVVLPPWLEPIYKDAALYAEPHEAPSLIDYYFRHADEYINQAQRGVSFSHRQGHSRYRELIESFMTAPADNQKETVLQ